MATFTLNNWVSNYICDVYRRWKQLKFGISDLKNTSETFIDYHSSCTEAALRSTSPGTRGAMSNPRRSAQSSSSRQEVSRRRESISK